MRIKSYGLGIIVLLLIFGGIGITMAFNQWQTETTKTPATYTSGEFTGEANPADIRGSYSFGDISSAWGIPVDTLAEAFNLGTDVDAAAFQVKELEAIYAASAAETEIGTDSVRVFVALYTGLPYALTDTTYLPQPAADILLATVPLDETQREYVTAHAVDISALEQISPVTDNATADNVTSDNTTSGEVVPDAETTHTETTEEGVIKGKTTFGDLLDWGLTQAEIEAVIGAKLPPSGTAVRDYAVAQGLEFAILKDELQAMLDALP